MPSVAKLVAGGNGNLEEDFMKCIGTKWGHINSLRGKVVALKSTYNFTCDFGGFRVSTGHKILCVSTDSLLQRRNRSNKS